MELSKRTVEILHNFNIINPQGLVWPEGNILTHKPEHSGNIIAVAELDETNDTRFAVYSVSQLLNCIRSFDTPQVVVDGLKIFISDTKRFELGEFVLNSAAEAVIKPIPKITFPTSANLSFTLSADIYKLLLKAVSIVEAPAIAIVGDGKQIYFTGLDTNNSGKGEFKVPIGDTDQDFRYTFPLDTINKLMAGQDYVVSITHAPTGATISQFKGDRITYYLAVKANA